MIRQVRYFRRPLIYRRSMVFVSSIPPTLICRMITDTCSVGLVLAGSGHQHLGHLAQDEVAHRLLGGRVARSHLGFS